MGGSDTWGNWLLALPPSVVGDLVGERGGRWEMMVGVQAPTTAPPPLPPPPFLPTFLWFANVISG